MKFLVIIAAFWVLMACGNTEKSVYGDDPAPTGDAAFEEVREIVKADCAKCHDGVKHPLDFNQAAVFKGSKAKKRIEAGTMPPNGQLDPDHKAKLLAYLGT